MKKNTSELFFFLMAVGCMGVVGMEIAWIFTTLITDGVSQQLIEVVTIVGMTFLWSILWGALSYKIVSQLKPAKTLNQKKQVIVSQLVVISILIALFVLGLIGCLVNQIKIGIIFCAAFIVSLTIWEVGCLISHKILNDEITITKQKAELIKKADEKQVKAETKKAPAKKTSSGK